MDDDMDEPIVEYINECKDEFKEQYMDQQSYPNDRLWAQRGNIFSPVSDVTKQLPGGAYRCHVTNYGFVLEKVPIVTDRLLDLPDPVVERLSAEVKKFWTLGEKYAEREFLHKRGLLMHGQPGTGKTCAIGQMIKAVVRDHNGLVVLVDHPQVASAGLRLLRPIEPERLVITVMEDLDELVKKYRAEGFLALLDGNAEIGKVLHVATTNELDRLDGRFVHRPARFDTIIEVGPLAAQGRRAYFKAKEPSLDDATLDRWVHQTEGYTIAHLREVIIAINFFGQDERAVFERLDSMREGAETNKMPYS
ncbi:AAA family ATPase [Bradyrhizobium sp. CB3481]|uniref:AAA family ATPase n=1 Tax=Bradyrhizobium sp. CB3481 TaxID=3039158 RepID=UPI0024B244EA|nr:AAA family ATPase [Bradyrhizobium sp. CB3481]WFU14621.1 AAA family ATPase [Bradyrhizobium sp. CB3481]